MQASLSCGFLEIRIYENFINELLRGTLRKILPEAI